MKKSNIFIIKENFKFDLQLILSKYPELKDYSVNIIPRQTKIRGADYSVTFHDRDINIFKDK